MPMTEKSLPMFPSVLQLRTAFQMRESELALGRSGTIVATRLERHPCLVALRPANRKITAFFACLSDSYLQTDE